MCRENERERIEMFEHVEKRNEDHIVKKISVIRVEGNGRKSKPKTKLMVVISEDTSMWNR